MTPVLLPGVDLIQSRIVSSQRNVPVPVLVEYRLVSSPPAEETIVWDKVKPHFVVESQDKTRCSSLRDHCIRARCIVRNTGDGSGVPMVEVDYLRGRKVVLTKPVEGDVLRPGRSATVEHEFKDAKLTLRQETIRCRIVP